MPTLDLTDDEFHEIFSIFATSLEAASITTLEAKEAGIPIGADVGRLLLVYKTLGVKLLAVHNTMNCGGVKH